VSLGHVLRVPFARVEREGWPSTVAALPESGFAVLALTPAPDAEPLARVVAEAPERTAVLVGAEGPGLTAEAMAVARRVRIPMAPGTDSVNVATAAAIALAALYDRAG
jgi:tRNA G18 (ribose-2'-O)-methylase SpoU